MEVSLQESITGSLKSNCVQKCANTNDKNCINSQNLNGSSDEKVMLENHQLVSADLAEKISSEKNDQEFVSNNVVMLECSDPTNNLSNTNSTKDEMTLDSLNGETSVGIKDSMKISVDTISVSSENKCSQPTDLEINLINDSKQETKNMSEEKKSVYRDQDSNDSWSDDEDSSSTTSSSGSDFFQMVVESSGPKNIPDIKTRGELGLDDLPPIEELTITIAEEDMMLIGKIHAVVDKLVVVHALKNSKPLDIDSVLFLAHDKPLGHVYDVFGPVIEPFYCIRFNSVDDINQKIIEIGADVFFAPEKNDITTYVFVDELQKEKGSDASWKHNNEPPEEFLDFSDDEQEKAAKRKRMLKNRNRRFSSSSDVSTKRPFVMNGTDYQQNSNRSENHSFSSPRSNVNVSPVQRFNRFHRSYSSHYRQSLSHSVPSIFEVPIFTSLSSPYPSLPPPSPTPSDSSIFTAPRFTPFSTSYPPPPPSPSPSVSSITGSLTYNAFSSSYPPPSPSPSVSNVTGAQGFAPFSNSYPPPSPSPSVSVIAASSSYSNPYPPRPPSPTPSVCSVMSVAVRARTRANFSTPKQPRTPFSHYRRQFSPQNAPQRFSTPSSNLLLRASSSQQSVSPIMLQPHQQPFLQRTFSPEGMSQRLVMPPQNVMQRPALPPQNIMQRQTLQYQRPLPPTLPQQTHVFGQVTLMSPLPSPLPPPPPVMPRFVSPPATTNFSVNPQGPPCHSPNVSTYSHIPPHYPLTVEIPNLTNTYTSVNPFMPGNNLVLPVSNNVIGSGQPPLY